MGMLTGASQLAKQFGSGGSIGQTFGAQSSIGSGLRTTGTRPAPLNYGPSWAAPTPGAPGAPQTPSMDHGADPGGFMAMVQRLFGPRRG